MDVGARSQHKYLTSHTDNKMHVLWTRGDGYIQNQSVTFTTKFITKLFKNTTLKIAFATQNTIGKLLSKQNNNYHSKFEKCVVYPLTCPDCKKKYMGQTGGQFHIRFQEHFHHYKYGNNKSKFAQHLLDNKHSTGPMENIMGIIRTMNKGC